MKHFLLAVITLFSFTYSFAQISYEKGYYIDNSNNKIEGYIKNIDWKNNPTEFDFKITQNSKSQLIKLPNVKTFEIFNASKYERHTVEVDVSNQTISDLASSDQPKWETREVFLKVLLAGNASLYQYTDGNIRKYFFNVDDSNIEQLVHKKYRVSGTRIGENNLYRQQLWNALKCENIQDRVKNVTYTKSSLLKIFKQYNTCRNVTFTDYESRVKRENFHLSLKPGINFSSVEIGGSSIPNYNFDFENKIGFQFGVEAEFVLNFNRNKWALIAEPTYISYAAEEEFVYLETSSGDQTSKVVIDYAAIEVPVGLRYYSYLSDSSKVFFNAFYMFNINLKDELYAERRELLEAKITPKGNFAIGVGYNYDNKYSVEFRYKSPKQLFPPNSLWGTYDYNSFAIIFGYTLF